MSTTYEADAKIRLSAEDDGASSTINSVSDSWRAYRKETLDAQHSTILSNTSLYETANVMRGVGHIAHGLVSIYNSYNLQQLRLSDAEDKVTAAQAKLNAAMASGDPKKIAEATKELTKAQDAQKRAVQESQLAWVLWGTEALGIIGRVGREIPKISALAKGLGGAGAIAGGSGALSTVASGAGGVGAGALGGIGGKLKSFAGSTAGKVLLPLAAGVGTYEFLTQTEEGKAINQYNPFKLLADAIFEATHTPAQVAQAKAAQGDTYNVKVTATNELNDQIGLDTMYGNYQP